MSKFTPGPWNIVRQSNDAGEPVYSIGSEFADGENKHIARVATAAGWSDVSGKSHRAVRPAEANARLIAAAPEMLEALKFIKAALVAKRTEDACTLTLAAATKLEYALAKATGGE